MQSGVRPLSTVAQIEAQIAEERDARTSLAAAQAELKRLRALRDESLVSQERVRQSIHRDRIPALCQTLKASFNNSDKSVTVLTLQLPLSHR